MRGLATLALVPLLSCGAATTEELQTRAAFDLDCPKNELELTELDSSSMGVTGCGQRATYVESCNAPVNSPVRDCTWVLNSDARPVASKKKRRPYNMDSDTASE